jgi:hypothetical protein
MANWKLVCRTRDGSASLGLSSDKIDARETRSWNPNYLVLAEDTEDPNSITEIDAMRAQGIPVLKRDVFVSEDGLIFPYFSCKAKSCERDSDNPLLFRISCDFEDESGDDGQDVQENPEDYLPSIRWSIKSRQRSSWVDAEGEPYILPTGSKYRNPLMLDYACRVAEVTQIEAVFSASIMKDRMLRLNTAAWNGIGASEALITSITYEEVEVPVGIGYIQNYVTAYRVKYSIEENDLVVKAGSGLNANINDNVNDAGASKDVAVGWDQMRSRIDSICKMPDGTLRTATSINPVLTSVYLQANGLYWHGPVSSNFPTMPPPIDTYKVYETTNFASFLRI